MIASPGNPSGTMLDRQALAALVARTQEIGAALVSDEIYHGLDYGARPVSALELTDDVVVINSFSKYFSMTGWRVGWMVVPQDMVRTIGRLAANMFICAPTPARWRRWPRCRPRRMPRRRPIWPSMRITGS